MPGTTRSRRWVLHRSLGGLVAAALCAGCREEALGPLCDDPLAEAAFEGLVSFVNERDHSFGVLCGEGLDAARSFDLSPLTEEGLVLPAESFFVRTDKPQSLSPGEPETIRIRGLVSAEVELATADLPAEALEQGVHLMECSGNTAYAGFGLIGAVAWSGVLLSEVLARVEIDSAATCLLVVGFDEHDNESARSIPGASWIFPLSDLEERGAFIATGINGEPLSESHGAPARLIVPGWYGCTAIKWITDLVLVDDQEPVTDQMLEFATRTQQDAGIEVAADCKPASLGLSAVVVRVEKWRLGDRVIYLLAGILWGGEAPIEGLKIRLGGDSKLETVKLCTPHTTNRSWIMWTHIWEPSSTGEYDITLEEPDPAVAAPRLESGWYLRGVQIDEVSPA